MENDDTMFEEGSEETRFSPTDAIDSEAPEATETLPEKFKGKSAAEIARIALEQERFIGRQAQEVGEIRRLADQLIQERLSKKQAQPQPEEESLSDIDFFADPVKAVHKAVESHPSVLQARAAAASLVQQANTKQLRDKHPDFKELIADPHFHEWVGASRIRQSLFAAAHQNYDVEAADELFSNYKELATKRASVVADGASKVRQNSDAAKRTAMTPSGGSGEAGKKIFRRADLIDLQIKNPDRYMALQDEIIAAYAEGRVR